MKDPRIPLYLITGFLDSGKTTLLTDTLNMDYFNDGQRTVLLMCEDGEEGTIAVMDVKNHPPTGLFTGYFQNPEMTQEKLGGAYYDTGMIEVNTALNATIGGTWYVVLGSSLAMLVSAVVNSTLNQSLGRMLKKNNFASFAFRSYVSTGVGQFIDNLVFAIIVSHTFFGWTWVQVLMCSLTGAVAELLCEVFLSPVGYKVVRGWERENVGSEYLERHATA